eukprot:CAMPEP_0168361864 /NCGR_PEP_ID=MMETSP0228-20121227/2883_1 /TAXON_ID=133427 /ORGANISM="Protoceratium reticulatum, Strain CCCM 535 (=CCMP 1889)" /LENGTH=433 /DNA_ID=CAMNT_0008374549 /DNA_START=24 /DNA_END=1321 /DNA_ORIENTATION=+
MDARIRLVFLAAIGGVLFLVGFLYGEIRITAPSSVELHTQNLNLKQRDVFVKTAHLDKLEKKTTEALAWAAIRSLTRETVTERQRGVHELNQLSELILRAAEDSLADSEYERARGALQLVRRAQAAGHERLEDLLLAAVGPEAANASEAGGEAGDGWLAELTVHVRERPFGAHVQGGSTRVSEVFPGFPAHRLGVRPGCEIVQVAGQRVWAGNWMEAFRRAELPFELRLRCPARGSPGRERLPSQGSAQDPHHYRVLVAQKPFGMNIQVHVAPRVVEVLPGYPAEAAGVRKGFVLIKVNERPVDAITWFKEFQNTPVPFTLTFDTTVPVHAGNPFLAQNASAGNDSSIYVYREKQLPPLADTDYGTFQCDVSRLPFGMHVRAPLDGWPTVVSVLPESPAAAVGVKLDDVLIEVAGLPVNSSTWFARFQQSAPP